MQFRLASGDGEEVPEAVTVSDKGGERDIDIDRDVDTVGDADWVACTSFGDV